MAVLSDPRLIQELERYGASDVLKCYHCGNCTATCPFSKEPFLFPRKSMRFLQAGLAGKLKGNLEPWLCYYCGECSVECPRQADPGETMMSLRRWLTAQYDVTGISRLFYTSWKAELAAILGLALLTGAAFLLWGLAHGSLLSYDGPRAFLASRYVHVFDWALGGTLATLLLANSVRMGWFTLFRSGGPRPSLLAFLRHAWLVPFHFFTQKRYRECEQKRPWAYHLALMLSYVTMLVLIMLFLHQVQAGPAIDWRVHGFGYAAALGLAVTVIHAIAGRIRRSEVHYKHSHESDWTFLALLLYVTLTGAVQHVLHRAGMPLAANLLYLAHLMGVVPMLALEVPFGKWAHLAYRPLAMYFAAVEADALLHRLPGPGLGARPSLRGAP